MSIMSLFNAKTHFSKVIQRVIKGEEIMITRHGVTVAKIVPVEQTRRNPKDVARLMEEFKAFSKGRTLGGLKIKDLINEGRR